MATLPPIRLLNDPAMDGPTNMARDEALLISVGARTSSPTLRLYEWDPPTVSLGYFQSHAAFVDLPAPADGLAVVRRLTGGGAILHDRELTYSWTLPDNHELLREGPNRLYEIAHLAITRVLREIGISANPSGTSDDSGPRRGPFFCFERRHEYDLVVDGEKIVGSAQRRTRDAVLQHGSIIAGNRFPQQRTATTTAPAGDVIMHVRDSLGAVLTEIAHVEVIPGEWEEHELTLATSLIPKYAGDDWTART